MSEAKEILRLRRHVVPWAYRIGIAVGFFAGKVGAPWWSMVAVILLLAAWDMAMDWLTDRVDA